MMIEIKHLVKTYKQKTVLHIDSLSIDKGEIVGVLGNNGAGKSTLLKLMLDLIQADRGWIKFKNQDKIAHTEKWKDYTGGFIDLSFLIDFLYPQEYFFLLGNLHHIDHRQVLKTIDVFKPLFNGNHFENSKLIRELSDGNKQKIGLVSAFLHDPEIVILDEPFNLLDPRIKTRLQTILLNLNKQKRTTMIISSNILESMVDLCTRMILLENGQVIKDNSVTPASIKELKDYFSA